MVAEKGQRTLQELNSNPPKHGSMVHVEGWDGGGKTSYGLEQRVWAVCFLNPELVDKSGLATSKIKRLMVFGDKYSMGALNGALSSLREKKIIHCDIRGKRTFGIYLLDPNNYPHEWAVKELRAQIESRLLQQKNKPEVVKMPSDYEATPEHLRGVKSEKVVVVNPPAIQAATVPVSKVIVPEVPLDVDLGELADSLLVSLFKKLNEPPTVVEVIKEVVKETVAKTDPDLRKKYEEARRYAFLMEGQVSAMKAQVDQLEKNLTAAIEADKDLNNRLDVAESRLRKYQDKERTQNRNTRLRDAISDSSKAALDQAKNGG